MMVGTKPGERPEIPIRILSSAGATERHGIKRIVKAQTRILARFIETSSTCRSATAAAVMFKGIAGLRASEVTGVWIRQWLDLHVIHRQAIYAFSVGFSDFQLRRRVQ